MRLLHRLGPKINGRNTRAKVLLNDGTTAVVPVGEAPKQPRRKREGGQSEVDETYFDCFVDGRGF